MKKKPSCDICKAQLNASRKNVILYSENYDAYYCKACNIWLENACDDLDCIFCAERPDKPVTTKQNDERKSS